MALAMQSRRGRCQGVRAALQHLARRGADQEFQHLPAVDRHLGMHKRYCPLQRSCWQQAVPATARTARPIMEAVVNMTHFGSWLVVMVVDTTYCDATCSR